MSNPKLATDAILSDEKVINDFQVYPLSIGRYAILELLKSPFLDPTQLFTTLNIIPSLYVMLHPIEDLKGYNSKNIEDLEQKALVWVEGIQMDKLSPIIKEVMDIVTSTFKMSPASGDDEGNGQKKSLEQ